MRQRGFTLLELLVVVAVIGIMASVVLMLTSTARNRGGDAGVKANLQTVRSQSGVFYTNNNLSYLPSGGSTFPIASCPLYNATGTNMLARDKNIADSIAEATRRGSNVNSCYNSSSEWAVAVGLKTNANLSWCVDSAGVSRQVNFPPATAINGTTFVCN